MNSPDESNDDTDNIEQSPPGDSLLMPLPSTQVIDPLNLATPTMAENNAIPNDDLVENHPGPASTNMNDHLHFLQEQGWQETKLTLTQRARFLLNNPRMSDVRFIVGEHKAEVFAHKTILAMGSPVFEAQFFGSLSENFDTNAIEVPDIEPDTFVLFLKVST